jgi:hypothetical protein
VIRPALIAAVLMLLATPTIVQADTALTGPCTPANTAIKWAEPLPGEDWDGDATGMHVNDDDTWTLMACEITLNPVTWKTMTRGQRCTIMLHEFGHLYFARHTRSGLMAPTSDGQWVPACHTVRERVVHDLEAVTPFGGQVACGKWQGRAFTCIASYADDRGRYFERRYRVRVRGELYAFRRIRDGR